MCQEVLRGFQRFSEVSHPSCHTVQLCLNPKSVLEFHKSKCDDMTVKVIFSSSAAPLSGPGVEKEEEGARKIESQLLDTERLINSLLLLLNVCVFFMRNGR